MARSHPKGPLDSLRPPVGPVKRILRSFVDKGLAGQNVGEPRIRSFSFPPRPELVG